MLQMRRGLLYILLYAHCTLAFNFNLLNDMWNSARKFSREFTDVTRDVPTDHMLSEYDFIVVGAGSAGAPVTNRLTEVKDWKVLLLEAGGEELFIYGFPPLHNHMQLTGFTWGYRAQPQDNACLGLYDRRCRYPQGKGMGGTSLINAMIYTRGHRRDYDAWESLGNPGWGWDDVLPYFKKSERARGDFADPRFHGKDGYLGVENPKHRYKILNAFLDSADELGYPRVDYNSGDEIGFAIIQATTSNGTRSSSNRAFLRPIRHRKNLHVAKFAQVTKVLIDPETKRAYGVEFYRNGRFHRVKARKEVILSAGAFNSPQLLMLSGIGPREHLESLHIPVVHDSPGVGANLQDHVTMGGLAFLVNDTVSMVADRVMTNVTHYLNYILYESGPFTFLGGPEALAYVRTPVARTPPDYPDIELLFIAGSFAADNGVVVRTGVGVRDDIYDSVFKPIENKDAWNIYPMITRQESRGLVRLKSKNPFAWPIIYANYFDDPHDLVTLVEGIKFAVKLSKTKAFQRYNSTLNDRPIPACKRHQFASDEYWACTARQLTTSLHHFCGTAKMGPVTDPMAVVDPELRVYGVQGLRVVDASIIPLIPAAHTNAAATMIGEKAADLIKQSYGRK